MKDREKEVFLGIDIGGTYVKWGLLDIEGSFICADSFETKVSEGREYLLARLCSLINQNAEVSQIGICIPGVVDSDKGVILNGMLNARVTSFCNRVTAMFGCGVLSSAGSAGSLMLTFFRRLSMYLLFFMSNALSKSSLVIICG